MYTIFAVFVLLFELLPRTAGDDCGGRREGVEDTSLTEAVNVAYKVFVAVVAVGMAVCFIIFGAKMYMRVHSSRLSANPVVLRKIFIVTMTCGASFACLAVFMLVVLLVGVANVFVGCACLFCIEIVPEAVVLWLLKPVAHSSAPGSLGSRSRGSRNTRGSRESPA